MGIYKRERAGFTERELLCMDRKGLVIAYILQYSMVCSLVFFKVTPVLVNIRFICHMHKAHDLRETRIYTINTALEKN